MRVLLIPGLGYSCELFQGLHLPRLETRCLNWIEPLAGESLNAYAKRFVGYYSFPNEPIVLIGHSFGGILAQEIASLFPVQQIILLSSIRSRNELPMGFRIIAPMRIHHLFTKEASFLTLPFWGASHGFDSEETRQLFRNMVGTYSNRYLQWALKSLSIWRSPETPSNTNITQIHGTLDRTFPVGRIQQPDILVENAGHIMVYKQAEKLSKLILKTLSIE
jgi:pimeloyl-ACP methyl ester carboxylesterase